MKYTGYEVVLFFILKDLLEIQSFKGQESEKVQHKIVAVTVQTHQQIQHFRDHGPFLRGLKQVKTIGHNLMNDAPLKMRSDDLCPTMLGLTNLGSRSRRPW